MFAIGFPKTGIQDQTGLSVPAEQFTVHPTAVGLKILSTYGKSDDISSLLA